MSKRAAIGFAGGVGGGCGVATFEVSIFGDSIFGVSIFVDSIFEVPSFGVSIFGGSIFGVSIFGVSIFKVSLGAWVISGEATRAISGFRSTGGLFVAVGRAGAVFEIFVSSSSRTVSWIMAPQVRQIDKVGARSRLQTGHIIGRIGLAWIEKVSATGKNAVRISEVTLRRQQ